MFLNILSGFHFAEKVISNIIQKFCSVLGGKDIKTQRVGLSNICRSKKIIHRPDWENVLGETKENQNIHWIRHFQNNIFGKIKSADF